MPDIEVPAPEASSARLMSRFDCARSDAGSAVRVTVAGELDIATLPELDRQLHVAQAEAGLVVLDLRRLEFIDLCAARQLLFVDRRIRYEGGRLVVVRGSAEVHWVFALIGLDRQLEFIDQPPADSLFAAESRPL